VGGQIQALPPARAGLSRDAPGRNLEERLLAVLN
jgi:hypothetical protein